jgi:beta-glucosidase
VGTNYLYTDKSRRQHGLTAIYGRNINLLDRPMGFRVDETVNVLYPEQMWRDPLPWEFGLYAKWTGVLVPPQTGDYQLGATARDAFRIYLDGKLIVDEFTNGGLRSSGNAVHLEGNKTYDILVEYYHAPPPVAVNVAPATAPAMQPRTVAASAPAPDGAVIQLRWTRPTEDGAPGDANGKPLYAASTELVKQADAVVVVLGIDATMEREEYGVHFAGFKGGDRTSLELPAIQENLLKQVTAAAAGKPVILVLTNGSALAVNWANEHVPAILEAWYPGQRGDAVAEVLFGDYNPGGRLPVTFYRSVEDLPAFTDYSMANRTYRYFTGPVLYPFGHGLSYSTFAYSDLAVKPAREAISRDMTVGVSVKVKNTSGRAGEEVVECYLNRKVTPVDAGSVPVGQTMSAAQAVQAALPRKSLAGFQRVALMAGEEKTVTFTVTAQQLSIVGEDSGRVVRPGEVTFQVGGSSMDGLIAGFTLEGAPAAPEYKFVAPKID